MKDHEERKDNQVRCECGKLYMVRTEEGYEVKCARCKKKFLISYQELISDYLTKECL